RRDESPASGDSHVGVRIGHDRATVAVDNLAVDTRVMIQFFFDNFERAGLGQMSVTAARDWRLHYHPPSLNQISGLLAQIDLNSGRIFALPKQRSRKKK